MIMKRKWPKLVVLDPEDFSEIALEKCVQRRQDWLDILSGRRTAEQVERGTIGGCFQIRGNS
jgi:hypothetical protein